MDTNFPKEDRKVSKDRTVCLCALCGLGVQKLARKTRK
jgi:hypothetical protein